MKRSGGNGVGAAAHITHVIDSLDGSGGSERQLIANLQHFENQLLRHSLVVIRPGGNSRLHEVPATVPVTVLFDDKVPSRAAITKRLYTALKPDRPELIHCVLPNASHTSRIVGPLLRVPVVESLVNISHEPIRTVDNPNVTLWKLTAHTWLDRVTMRHLAGYHAVGPTVAESWHRTVGLPLNKMEIIPRGIPPESRAATTPSRNRALLPELGLPEEAFVLLSVGRQEPQKGQRYLLEAMPAILRAVPEAHLLLAGRQGASTPVLTTLVQELALGGRVHLLGSRSDVSELLAAADVFVFPSLFEGNGGNALIEAMASGCTVIVSDAPPMTEVADSERVAVLVPRRDPAGIASAVIELHQDPTRRLQLGTAAFDRIQAEPGPEVRARQTEDWYARLLGVEAEKLS